jgi:hypothetical protein
MRRVDFMRLHIDHYRIENPHRIYAVCGTMECKLLISELESMANDMKIFCQIKIH